MNVTATAPHVPDRVTARPLIRPPDPAIRDLMLRIYRYSSVQQTRILLHCFFRDAQDAIDLTNGAGSFWKQPYPPGLTIITNNIDPTAPTDLHVDFTSTGLPDHCYDVAVIDPPHLPHLAPTSFMARRYGTVRSTPGLHVMIAAGVAEAWRVARIGIIVKLTDFPNGGAYLPLTSWAVEALGVWPVFVTHTIGRPTPRLGGETQRVPRNNGADWLVFRKGSNRYPDFVSLYERQQASRLASLTAARRCAICDTPLGDRRADAATCSNRCRQAAHRRGGAR
jgi:hypothetical protein